MLFKVKNLGLIDEAEIKLDGITIITGENNVGKSTIGKMLYCVNNVFLRDRIDEVKIRRIERVIINHYEGISFPPVLIQGVIILIRGEAVVKKIVREASVFSLGISTLREFLTEIIDISPTLSAVNLDDHKLEDLVKKIQDVLSMTVAEIFAGLISMAVGTNFSGITHNTYTDNKKTVIEISSEKMEQNVEITITEDEAIVENFENVIFQETIYIESPRVAQDSEKKSLDPVFDPRQRVLQMLTEESDIDYWETKEMKLELKTILDKISSCAPGNLVKQDSFSNKLVYEEEGQRFDLINVSNGVKTFAILKKLLVNAKLKRNGMLILDEPEIHLHPDWSTIFAEILVLLQKQFNLRVLINTHSGDFLMALEEYSKLHKVDKSCNYYLIKRNGHHSTCEDCTDHLNKIYQHFANFYDDLDNLRYDDDQ